MTDSEIKKIRTYFFNKYVRPHMGDKPVLIAQTSGSNPLRILVAKIVENNPHFKTLGVTNFNGEDPCALYGKAIGYNNDRGKNVYLFVDDKIILIDNHDKSHWNHCAIGRVIRYVHPKAVDACIKTQYADKCGYDRVPFPVYPFVYPSINDYRTMNPRYPVYYDKKYRTKFLECARLNKFKYSIFMRWNKFTVRDTYTELSQLIPGSNVCSKNTMPLNEYMDNISQSKFAIGIRGGGKWSHRELEVCSIGVPLFCEDRNQKMWNPFIPDTHFINVTPETFLEKFDYYNNHYNEALEIGRKGREYYENNHPQEKIQEIFKEIIDLIKGYK